MTVTFTKDVTFDVEIDYTIKATSVFVGFRTHRRNFFEGQNKKTEKITFSGQKLEDCRSVFSEAVGFDLTIVQMLEVVFSSDRAFEDFCQIRQYPDTAAKDIFSRAFGEFVLKDGRHWPLGGDSREYTEKFFNDLNATADVLGYISLPQ